MRDTVKTASRCPLLLQEVGMSHAPSRQVIAVLGHVSRLYIRPHSSTSARVTSPERKDPSPFPTLWQKRHSTSRHEQNRE
jgi:hypothetical protein